MINSAVSLGEILKTRRIIKNIEKTYICNQLKIKLADIEAIEENNWSYFKKHLYLPGFIRSYCKILGLNNKEIDKLIKGFDFESNTANVKHKLINVTQEEDRSPDKEMFLNFVLISIIVFFVFLTISNSMQKNSHLIKNSDLIDHFKKDDDSQASQDIVIDQNDIIKLIKK